MAKQAKPKKKRKYTRRAKPTQPIQTTSFASQLIDIFKADLVKQKDALQAQINEIDDVLNKL